MVKFLLGVLIGFGLKMAYDFFQEERIQLTLPETACAAQVAALERGDLKLSGCVSPIVTRFITYSVPVPPFAALYMKAVLSHPHVNEWIDKAQDEPWVIEQYEVGKAA